jgi:hypothetical protein
MKEYLEEVINDVKKYRPTKRIVATFHNIDKVPYDDKVTLASSAIFLANQTV